MNPTDGAVIVATGTPPGRGAHALVRCSGMGILSELDGVLRGEAADAGRDGTRGIFAGTLRIPEWPETEPERRGATAKGELLVPCLAAVFPGPATFTGEDVLEVLVPGHPALVEVVNRTLIAHFGHTAMGARPAGPGEFSARAFLAGRLSPGQASGIADLIAADRDEDLEVADRLRRGLDGQALSESGSRLAETIARIEAGIDFTEEEDVIACSVGELRAMIASTRHGLESIASWARNAGPAQRDRPLVVLAGPPNAGKSTLFNAMVGDKRVVVSPVPGTTRDLVQADLNIDHGGDCRKIRLVDTAGLGESEDPLQDLASARAHAALEEADLVLWCVPSKASTAIPPPHQPESESPSESRRYVSVRTKMDLDLAPQNSNQNPDQNPDQSPNQSPSPSLGVVCISLRPGRPATGLHELNDQLSRRLEELEAGGDRLASSGWRRRQAASVKGAMSALDAVEVLLEGTTNESGTPSPEIIADELQAALNAIRQLEGDVDPDEVLDLVFGRFCIGK